MLGRLTPPAMLRRFNEMCEESPHLRTLSWILDEGGKLQWLHSIGVLTDDELMAQVPPFPPIELRRITGATQLPAFLWTGLVDLVVVLALYEAHAEDERSETSVLDFGCGCGRLIRFLGPLNGWTVHGCDVDASHVSWCDLTLPRVRGTQVGFLPPSPYPDEAFDLIYSFSVYTHLSERHAGEWLREMSRILAPGGIAVVTTHGEPVIRQAITSEPHRRLLELSPEDLATLEGSFDEVGFHFRRYPTATETSPTGAEYGITFIHPGRMGSMCADAGLEVLRHEPGGMRGYQDIFVLRRRDEASPPARAAGAFPHSPP